MHQYAAGLIDGEGYIGIQASGGSYQVRLKIGMSDKGKPALEQMVRLYGGRIDEGPARNDRNRETATWVVTGERAADIIREVKPWLFVKAEAAEIALQLQLMLEVADKLPNGRREWTAEMRGRAEELRSRIQHANRRGPDPEPNPNVADSTPVAKYRGGTWWDSVDSLFGPEHFGGKFPASGKMIDGIVYEHTAPPPEPHTAETESSSSPGLPTPRATRGGSATETVDLLPTPRVSSGNGTSEAELAAGNPYSRLETEVELLRTPCAAEAEGGMLHPDKAKREGQTLRLSPQIVHMVAPDQLKDDLLATGGKLLPTPLAGDADHVNVNDPASRRSQGRSVGMQNVAPTIVDSFGPYADAIARWEAVMGRPAPAPTELTAKGKHRLSAKFVEWMMGQSEGWVTDEELGLSRVQQLRALGNGVVAQQAVFAINWLIERAQDQRRKAA